jgi:integrase
VRAKRPQRLPVVLARHEVLVVLRQLEGVPRLMASLLYGAGLRLLECCRLRAQDIDFATNQIVVRGAKGDKDRMTMLPAAIKGDLGRRLGKALVNSIGAICRTAPAGSSFRTRSRASTRMRGGSGFGSGYSPRHGRTVTVLLDSSDDIISANLYFSASSKRPCTAPGLRSEPRCTPSATLSRRISSKTAATFVPSRNCLAIGT